MLRPFIVNVSNSVLCMTRRRDVHLCSQHALAHPHWSTQDARYFKREERAIDKSPTRIAPRFDEIGQRRMSLQLAKNILSERIPLPRDTNFGAILVRAPAKGVQDLLRSPPNPLTAAGCFRTSTICKKKVIWKATFENPDCELTSNKSITFK